MNVIDKWSIYERCAMIARGTLYPDRFKSKGLNQAYWKGRSDAAEEIRAEMREKMKESATKGGAQ